MQCYETQLSGLMCICFRSLAVERSAARLAAAVVVSVSELQQFSSQTENRRSPATDGHSLCVQVCALSFFLFPVFTSKALLRIS